MSISILQEAAKKELAFAKKKYISASQLYKSINNTDSTYGREVYRLSMLHFKIMQIWESEINEAE
jgi:hypothetical protein